MLDFVCRCAYRAAYRGARVYWWLRQPRTRGALVAVWHGDRLLIVEQSYRSECCMPGGFVGQSEDPRDAAVRELEQELGIRVQPRILTYIGEAKFLFEDRISVDTFFELRLQTAPPLKIDRREIVAAHFLSLAEARDLKLIPPVRWYVERLSVL